jgi:hypothetical protein
VSAPQFTPGPWKVVIDGTLTGAWAEVSQECIDPDTNETWDRELFRSETTHVRKADHYPPNGSFRPLNEAPEEWELTEDGAEHLANARLIAAAPELYEAARLFVEEYDAGEDVNGVELMLSYNRALEAGKSALAKARGEVRP